MQKGCTRTWLLGLLLFSVLGTSGPGRGQHTSPGQLPSGLPPIAGPPSEQDPALSASRRKLAEQRNEDRQKQLVSDSDKLLQLATSLHEDVAKTNKNVLSLDVIKRADEIEKLAHEVKERMRTSS